MGYRNNDLLLLICPQGILDSRLCGTIHVCCYLVQ
eukprot:XP_001705077.1 Hypothetical protein GL50803_31086 [Giardia lamblia ATCC 50803]